MVDSQDVHKGYAKLHNLTTVHRWKGLGPKCYGGCKKADQRLAKALLKLGFGPGRSPSNKERALEERLHTNDFVILQRLVWVQTSLLALRKNVS